jgi:outer membrane lipoprotein-sorting protein
MKLKFLFVIAFALLFLAGISLAAEETDKVDELLQKVRYNQSLIQDFRADMLVKTAPSKKAEQKIIKRGTVLVQGDKFRVKINFPKAQEILSRGDTTYVISPTEGLFLKLDTSLFESFSRLPLITQFPLDPYLYLKHLEFAYKGLEEGRHILIGVPRQKIAGIRRINYYIDARYSLPVRIAIYSEEDVLILVSEVEYKFVNGIWVPHNIKSLMTHPSEVQQLEIEYQDIKLNQGISREVFSF